MMVGTILPLFEKKIEISSVDLLLEFKAVISVIRNMKPSFRIDRENLLVCCFCAKRKNNTPIKKYLHNSDRCSHFYLFDKTGVLRDNLTRSKVPNIPSREHGWQSMVIEIPA